MIRTTVKIITNLTSWPRTSGDDPSFALQECCETLLAPHERG